MLIKILCSRFLITNKLFTRLHFITEARVIFKITRQSLFTSGCSESTSLLRYILCWASGAFLPSIVLIFLLMIWVEIHNAWRNPNITWNDKSIFKKLYTKNEALVWCTYSIILITIQSFQYLHLFNYSDWFCAMRQKKSQRKIHKYILWC